MAEILEDILKAINKLEQKQDANQKNLNVQLQEIRQQNKEIKMENKEFRDELNHTWQDFTQLLLYYNVGNTATSMYHNINKG